MTVCTARAAWGGRARGTWTGGGQMQRAAREHDFLWDVQAPLYAQQGGHGHGFRVEGLGFRVLGTGAGFC
jgi:hypothetical protein